MKLDLTVGRTSSRTMTVTENHVRSHAEISGDHKPLQFDPDFVARTRFGRRVARGGLTTGIPHALVAGDLPGPGTVFLSQDWKFTAPVFIGDTITGSAEVLCVHESRPVCRLHMKVERQGGETVLEGEAWCYRFTVPEAAEE
jgi:acyl dehydratase